MKCRRMWCFLLYTIVRSFAVGAPMLKHANVASLSNTSADSTIKLFIAVIQKME
jgi:hypothetical protein